MPPCQRPGAAAWRTNPTPEARGSSWEAVPHAPTPEARGGGWEDQPHVQGAVAAREEEDQPHVQGAVAAREEEGLEELSHTEGQEGWWLRGSRRA